MPLKSPLEVKSLSGCEGCEKEEVFHQSTLCDQAPWAGKLFSIISCLVLMNWLDSCSFRNYQMKKKIAGEIFQQGHMGRKPV